MCAVIDRDLERLLVSTLGPSWQLRWEGERPSVVATLVADGQPVGSFQIQYGRCWGPWTPDRKPIPEVVKDGFRAVRDALWINAGGKL